MASAEKTVIMQASADKIYQVLKDFESYPEFMDGVSSVSIVSEDGDTTRVQYNLNLIKKITYTLDITCQENQSLKWQFVEGDLFSINNGSWTLKDQGDGSTEVTYQVEVDIKVKMIGSGMIVKKLTEVQLPSMLKAVEERANAV